jgi:hypothetical protein
MWGVCIANWLDIKGTGVRGFWPLVYFPHEMNIGVVPNFSCKPGFGEIFEKEHDSVVPNTATILCSCWVEVFVCFQKFRDFDL